MADEPFDERPAGALGNFAEAGTCKQHAVRPDRGFFSRSSDHISRVERDFSVLYVNREISGAVVVRHTFGGFKMVGFGTKAEGPDYLLHFMLSRCVPVSMVRSGFVPRAG